MAFIHLHTHSDYTLLQGLPKVQELVDAAVKEKMSALALTDAGNMYGTIEFFQACQKAGIKPILGSEIFLTSGPTSASDRGAHAIFPFHLVLLCENLEGYHNLIRLVTESHLKGLGSNLPMLDESNLSRYHSGLIALSGNIFSAIPTHLRNGREEEAMRTVQRYQKIFGERNFFLEVTPHSQIPEQGMVNEKIFALGAKLGVPIVATNDVHYIHRDDAEAQDILVCIGQKRLFDETDRHSVRDQDLSFRSEEEMRAVFSQHPEAIDQTARLADRIQCELALGQLQIPHFQVPEGLTYEQMLEKLCVQGLKTRYQLSDEELQLIQSGELHTHDEVLDRMKYELSIIQSTGFASYFLIVADIVNWAKSHGIVVGPGRGSAAGSLVSYLLNITNVDPLQYDLLFERFLNPERISMPDIDLDFADTRRDEVIEYVKGVYSEDHVAHIITFGTMAARAAVRDVGRVLGFPYGFCDRIAKLIPMFTDLEAALKEVAELQTLYDEDPDARRLLDQAKKLEGVSRHTSLHACGILITKGPLVDHTPVQFASDEDHTLVCQYSLHPIEDLGLLKMDFLGLKNLTIIEDTLNILRATQGISFNMDQIDLDDDRTFQLFQRGETTGVFQFESAGMKRYLKQLKPTELEDIIAMVALYRPGPMEFIPEYIDGKQGRRRVEYLHPKLEPILSKTYGIAVYQEQVMQIARDICGFTLGEADVLRKAIGKKIKSLLLEQRDKFIEGGMKNGIPRHIAEKLFDFTEPFARYGFNRSHAACYGLIGYQTAFLKANYPASFMAALMTSDQDNSDRIAIEVTEAKRMGISVEPPDINESFATFSVVHREGQPDRIRFGLSAIKNVGSGAVEAIIRERKAHGAFQTMEEFLQRVRSKDLNKKSMESLIKAGAFDRFGDRNHLFTNVEIFLQYSRTLSLEDRQGQTNIFGLLPEKKAPSLKLKQTTATSKTQMLQWEKELLGLYVSDHPLSDYEEIFLKIATPIRELARSGGKEKITIAGAVKKVKKILTKKKESMLFATIEDMSGSVEVLVFPKSLQKYAALLQEDAIVKITGSLSTKDDEPKLLLDKAEKLDLATLADRVLKTSAPRSRTKALNIVLRAEKARAVLPELKILLDAHPGKLPVFMTIIERQTTRKIRTATKIEFSDNLKAELSSLLTPSEGKLEILS